MTSFLDVLFEYEWVLWIVRLGSKQSWKVIGAILIPVYKLKLKVLGQYDSHQSQYCLCKSFAEADTLSPTEGHVAELRSLASIWSLRVWMAVIKPIWIEDLGLLPVFCTELKRTMVYHDCIVRLNVQTSNCHILLEVTRCADSDNWINAKGFLNDESKIGHVIASL